MPSAEHRIEIVPMVSHGLESPHFAGAPATSAGLKLSLEAAGPARVPASLAMESSGSKAVPLVRETAAHKDAATGAATAKGTLGGDDIGSSEKSKDKIDRIGSPSASDKEAKAGAAEAKLAKKEQKEEKEHDKEAKDKKARNGHEPKMKDGREDARDRLPRLDVIGVNDRDIDEKHKREKPEKNDLKTAQCTGAEHKLTFVGDDNTGATFRETKCDASGNPVVMNYDRGQKLMLKMYTKPDGVKVFEDYEDQAHGSAPKQGVQRLLEEVATTGSTEKLTPPASIDEEQARHGRILKSEMLEFPDKHTELVDHNTDGSYRVRSAFTKDMVDTDTVYDKNGRVITRDTIDWGNFAGKTK
jgi:hypothetical protein